MSDKVKVILLQQVQGVVNGVFTRFIPDDSGRKITALPRAMYEELKGKEPPVFDEIASDSKADEGDVIPTDVFTVTKQESTEKVADNLKPITPIEFADGDADESTETTAPTAAFIPARPTRERMEAELAKIKGVGASLAKTLFEAGYETPADIAHAEAEELIELPGISEKTVAGIQESANELMVA